MLLTLESNIVINRNGNNNNNNNNNNIIPLHNNKLEKGGNFKSGIVHLSQYLI